MEPIKNENNTLSERYSRNVNFGTITCLFDCFMTTRVNSK